MARPRTPTDMTCQNTKCKYFLIEVGKDILKRGKNKAGHQQYFCNHCKKWFVETANTPLYHKQLRLDQIKMICKLLVERNGIRSIERITGHHRDTIGRLLDDLAVQAEKFNDLLLSELKLTPVECDEFWSFLKKNKRKLSPGAQQGLMKVMPGHSLA